MKQSSSSRKGFNCSFYTKKNNPNIFNVDYILGHDEVAGPRGIGKSRKQDPGGALSMTMTELRELVKKKTLHDQLTFAVTLKEIIKGEIN